jgi:putative FmdB family regulatory protein
MPLYDFICAEGHKFERHVPLADFEVQQFCPCAAPAIRAISAPRISRDYADYQCPVTGKLISGRRQHEENLKQTGSRVLEAGEKESNEAARLRANAEFEASVDQSVEKFIDTLPSDKKERLANELSSGLDLSVERK